MQDNPQGFGHSAQGYLLPCCWCDNHTTVNDPLLDALFDEELKISNVDNIQTIVMSDQWLAFTKAIIGDVEKAPNVCKMYCGELPNTKETIIIKPV